MNTKPAIISKTVLFNLFALIVALVQYYQGPLPLVDSQHFNFAVIAINMGLRFVTRRGIHLF